MVLFIALFRMASFIMLPQSSPITLAIIGYLKFDYELGLARIARTAARVERNAQQYLSKGYQLYEAFVASFLPWLVLAIFT